MGSWLGALRLCCSGGPFLLAFLRLFHQQCHAALCLSDFWLEPLGVKEAPTGCSVVSLYRGLEWVPSPPRGPDSGLVLDLSWSWRGVSGALFLCLHCHASLCFKANVPLCRMYGCSVGKTSIYLQPAEATWLSKNFYLLRNLHTGAVVA